MEKKENKKEKINFVTPWGKISFPCLVAAKPFSPQSKPKFSAGLFLLKDDLINSGLLDAVERLSEEAGFNKPVFKAGKQVVLPWHSPIKFKEEYVRDDGTSKVPPQIAHMDVAYLSSSTGENFPPLVVGPDARPYEPSLIVGGDICRLRIAISVYETPQGRGITCYLGGVQLKRHATDEEKFSAGSGMSAVTEEQDSWDVPF